MRESLEDGETLQEAVLRGCLEEYGATGVIEKYLGAKIDIIVTPTKDFQKCTLYHAVRLTSLGERTGTDAEKTTELEWYSPTDLLMLLDRQCAQTTRPELDEREVIRRFIESYALTTATPSNILSSI
jgi:8-oxo-dGTP pyrophosphatase MutT (NUDIX family)